MRHSAPDAAVGYGRDRRRTAALGGKKISLFVTHHLPLPWMGGNNAIKQMKQLCEDKGGQVQSHAVISWNERRREVDIAGMLNRLA